MSLKTMKSCLFFVLLALPSSLLAQSTYGLIVGVVSDESKAVVPGATVTAKNEATNIERAVETSDQGEFRITNLLPELIRSLWRNRALRKPPLPASSYE